MKKEIRKIEKKSISLKNIVEDMKSLYEDIVEEKINLKDENTQIINLNENEYIQITSWKFKNLYDFTHYKHRKIALKGAMEYKDNKFNVTAIYTLNFGVLTSEADYESQVYNK